MNKKGQALVEFVLILPILIFLILAMIDIARLMIMKNHLESLLIDVDNNTTSVNDKEYNISVERSIENGSVFITLKSCIYTTTPGMNRILGNPACVTTSKEIKE